MASKHHPFHPRNQNAEFLDKATKLVKEMGFYGLVPQAVKMKSSKPLSPQQLLNIQVMMGHTHGMPTTITLGASPDAVYKNALAFDYKPVIEILEMHGAKKTRHPKKSHS